MRSHLRRYTTIFFVASLISLCVIGWRLFDTPPGPVARFPATINLGMREFGERITQVVEVANVGQSTLIIDQIAAAGCSCSGLEQDTGGQLAKADVISIEPGGTTRMYLRITARGVPGRAVENAVRFRTNDPSYPNGEIRAIISQLTAGVLTIPASVAFGAVPLDEPVRSILEIRDTADDLRTVESAVSNSPDQISVRLLPKIPEAAGRVVDRLHEGVMIARCEITVLTNKPGPIDSSVLLYLSGNRGKPQEIRVVGNVLRLVDVSPDSIVLPRRSPNGLVYSASCFIRCTHRGSFDLQTNSLPKGITVQLGRPTDSGICSVRIDLDPNQVPLGRHELFFKAIIGSSEATIRLPVVYTRLEGA